MSRILIPGFGIIEVTTAGSAEWLVPGFGIFNELAADTTGEPEPPVYTPIYKDFSTPFNILSAIYETFELLYDLRTNVEISKTIDLINNLTFVLSQDFEVISSILVSFDLEIPYGIQGAIAEIFEIIYNLEFPVSTDYVLLNSIIVSADWSLPNSIMPTITEITKTFEIKIPILLSKDFELIAGLNANIYVDTILRNKISADIFADIELKTGIIVSTDTVLSNSINSVVSSIIQLRNNITGMTNKDTEIKSKILSYNPVTVEFELRNTLLGIPMFYRITFID